MHPINTSLLTRVRPLASLTHGFLLPSPAICGIRKGLFGKGICLACCPRRCTVG